jgi:hypothetical protein
MHETSADLAALQRILEESYAAAGEHLRSVFPSDRRLSATELCRLLPGTFQLDLAAVTGGGRPLVAPVDGVFFRAKIWFGFPPGSTRGRLLRARPSVSATHTKKGSLCVIAHGTGREVAPRDPEYAAYEDYLREVYGPVLDLSRARYKHRQGFEYNAYVEPAKLFAFVPHPEA